MVQKNSLTVKEPKKFLKENKCPTRVADGHTTESETYPGKKIFASTTQFSIICN